MTEENDSNPLREAKKKIGAEARVAAGKLARAANGLFHDIETKFAPDSTADELIAKLGSQVHRKQLELEEFLSHETSITSPFANERIDLLKETLHRHLGELQGDEREIETAISGNTVDMPGKLSQLRGTMKGSAFDPNDEWGALTEILNLLNDISSSYLLIHAVAVANEKTMAAGMAWNHLRSIEIHISETVASIYSSCTAGETEGKPVEPVFEKSLEEWRRARESALRFASTSLEERRVCHS